MIEQQRQASRVVQQQGVCYLQFEHFLQFPEIVHGVFTRLGGHSLEPFRGLNVAAAKGDYLEHVLRNRLLTLQSLRLENYPCATLWQVHSADVAIFDRDNWDDWRSDWEHRSYYLDEREIIWTRRPRRKADALVTNERNVVLAMSFADCVPLLFYDPARHVIGIAHAGWRGTARGVAITTVEAMGERFGSRPEDIYTGIAPSIGACCYEVSERVQDLFHGQMAFSEMPTYERLRNLVRESSVFSTIDIHAGSSLRLDLWETNRNQLRMAGILPEHIEVAEICTSCNQDRFFSHRGEQGHTGRFPVVMALRNPETSEEAGHVR